MYFCQSCTDEKPLFFAAQASHLTFKSIPTISMGWRNLFSPVYYFVTLAYAFSSSRLVIALSDPEANRARATPLKRCDPSWSVHALPFSLDFLVVDAQTTKLPAMTQMCRAVSADRRRLPGPARKHWNEQ
jgi:hypothetical protein